MNASLSDLIAAVTAALAQGGRVTISSESEIIIRAPVKITIDRDQGFRLSVEPAPPQGEDQP